MTDTARALVAAAQSAPQLSIGHSDPQAVAAAAMQAAVVDGVAYHVDTHSYVTRTAPPEMHKRFNPDGTVVDVAANGTEKPARERVVEKLLANMQDGPRIETWLATVPVEARGWSARELADQHEAAAALRRSAKPFDGR